MRSRLHIFIAFALILRSLLAPGVMLGPNAESGTFTVVLCTGHGSETITLDAHGNPAKPADSRYDAGVCAYASSAPVAAALPASIVLPVSFPTATAFPLPQSPNVRLSDVGGSASARGPPLGA